MALFNLFKRWFQARPAAIPTPSVPLSLRGLFQDGKLEENVLTGSWKGRPARLTWEEKDGAAAPVLELACEADLWCRKCTSVTTMLDPSLFETYSTGDDRIDEDWIVQTNPPSAFRKEFTAGCDALLALLQEDPGLHATHGWASFHPQVQEPLPDRFRSYFDLLFQVVQTAERELKPQT